MTIGIGVLCSTQPKPYKPRPDAIVMLADTMGSTDTDSTHDLHKIWISDDQRVYATGAGSLEYGGELFAMIEDNFKALPKRTHGLISGALNQAVHTHRAQHFQWDVAWAKLNIPGVGPVADANKIREEWEQFYPGIHMLVATFDESGQAFLYFIGKYEDSHKMVHLCEFPGTWAIGTGSDNARFWLNYRRQVFGLNIKQSAYHAFEAAKMAAKSPTVNDTTELVIVPPQGKSFHLTEEHLTVDGCPVSIPELELMFKKYGPRKTDLLGHQTIEVKR